MIIGYLMRQHHVQFNDVRLFAAMSLLYVAYCLTGPTLNMNARSYPNFILIYAAGVGGTYIVYFASRILERLLTMEGARLLSAHLCFLGRNSLVIMAFHLSGYYFRTFVLTVVLPHHYDTSLGAIPTFFCLMAASLISIYIIRSIPLLNKIYHHGQLATSQAVEKPRTAIEISPPVHGWVDKPIRSKVP